MTGVILLAAGQGSRFGSGATSKQFVELQGKAVFLHALDSYLQPELIDQIVLLVPPNKVADTETLIRAIDPIVPTAVRAGGNTRQLSIRAGMQALADLNADGAHDYVILHNAASPNTDLDTLRRCLQAASRGHVAQACIPETRTQFLKNGALADKMLMRQDVATACDPTVFPAAILHALLEKQAEKQIVSDTTTDLAMELGYDVELVESDPGNLKVTGPWDLATLAAAMSDKQR